MKILFRLLLVSCLFGLNLSFADDGGETPLKEFAIDKTVSSKHGLHITVKSVLVFPQHVSIRIRAMNVSGQKRELAKKAVRLVDNNNVTYRFSAPKENSTMLVSTDSVLEGDMVFLGPGELLGTSAVLDINYTGKATDYKWWPTVTFELDFAKESSTIKKK